jgi:hypothetical protein
LASAVVTRTPIRTVQSPAHGTSTATDAMICRYPDIPFSRMRYRLSQPTSRQRAVLIPARPGIIRLQHVSGLSSDVYPGINVCTDNLRVAVVNGDSCLCGTDFEYNTDTGSDDECDRVSTSNSEVDVRNSPISMQPCPGDSYLSCGGTIGAQIFKAVGPNETCDECYFG